MFKWLSDLVWNRHLKSVAAATDRDAIRMAEFGRMKPTAREEVAAIQSKVLREELLKSFELTEVPRPNHRRLANGCWLLRTQAGFMQACRAEQPDWTRKQIRTAVNAWPTQYPAVVRIRKYGVYLDVTALPIDQYRAETQALLDDLAGD